MGQPSPSLQFHCNVTYKMDVFTTQSLQLFCMSLVEHECWVPKRPCLIASSVHIPRQLQQLHKLEKADPPETSPYGASVRSCSRATLPRAIFLVLERKSQKMERAFDLGLGQAIYPQEACSFCLGQRCSVPAIIHLPEVLCSLGT